MKKIILIILLLFQGYICMLPQVNVVFRLGENVLNTDKILFRAKNKFPYSNFYTEDKIPIHKIDDKTYSLTIDQPTVILVAMKPDVNTFHEIYLSTSDTITIEKVYTDELNGFALSLSGSNNGHYNYYVAESKWNKAHPIPFYKKNMDLDIHKETVREWITLKKAFFLDYTQKNDYNDNFITFIKDQIDSEYTFLLLSPLSQGVVNYPPNYMDGNIIGNYNSRLFVVASDLYIRWYREIEKYDLIQMKDHINDSFEGDTREYLVTIMLGKYADGEKVDSQEYFNLTSNYQATLNDQSYISYIESSADYFSKSLVPIPDSILKETFLQNNINKISLYDLLNSNKGKNVILDFWASWCAPCIKDIKKSYEMTDILVSNNIAYIYISIDIDVNAWRQTSERLNITNNQYRLINHKEAPILKYLKIEAIPRYIYLDGKRSIKNLNGKPPLIEYQDYFKNVFDYTYK